MNNDTSLVHKIRLHGRRGKRTTESFSREKLRQAPQKEGGEILCDPGWYVHKPDVQNNWDGNIHTHTHTHTQITDAQQLELVDILIMSNFEFHTIRPATFFFFFLNLTYSRWTSSLLITILCLWSLRIFPSLPGSRLTIFYRDASSALFLQLINQWLNFTYSRSHAFRYERKT